MEYLSNLNNVQRQAVETTDGPLLVLAGAGTGKTRVLTSRIAHILLTKKAFPSQVLAVTFTNKAAREMMHRVEQMLGQAATGLWLGTFHSIGAKIMRRHADYVGLSRDFTILDADDQHRLVKQIMEPYNFEDKRFPAKVALALIQGWKDRALKPEQCGNEKESFFADGKLPAIYAEYQRRLKSLNAVDFGDLIMHPITIFTQNPEILQEYASRFHYMLVDEYQDTNVAQYLWLRLLATGHNNICCVGDDDQSIYSWRGAEVANILRFEKDFAGAEILRLEENYRSTPHILAAASGLIANNEERWGKTLFTTRNDGDKVEVHALWDEKSEAALVVDALETMQRNHESLDDAAVLVRAGFQTRSFEEAFIQNAIPYRVIGNLRFYERKEVRDIIAYLRLVQNADDTLALERIINMPRRGIGDSTLEKISVHAAAGGISAYAAAADMIATGKISGKAGKSLQVLFDYLASCREKNEGGIKTDELVEEMIEQTGYRSMLEEEKTEESRGRLENLKELVRSTEEYPTLYSFLEHVGLVADRERPESEQEEMVTLMTMHAAKGLEFDVIFLPGWEEGVFPHQRALDENGNKGLEEERRLAYVGITRAKKRALISHVTSRRIHNQWQNCTPSRFIAELPPEHINVVNHLQNMRSSYIAPQLRQQINDILQSTPQHSYSSHPSHLQPPPSLRYGATSAGDGTQRRSNSSSPYGVGAKVKHSSFGEGRILSRDGDKLTICFETAGIKKIMQEFVERV